MTTMAAQATNLLDRFIDWFIPAEIAGGSTTRTASPTRSRVEAFVTAPFNVMCPDLMSDCARARESDGKCVTTN